jgi:hypothetical protein
MSYNKDCDKIVFVCYPGGAGGKFLINCLALSDNAFLQDNILINRQLEGNLPPSEKLAVLLDRLSKVKRRWNDLEMGDSKIFGEHQYTKSTWPELVTTLSNQHKRFFKVIHRHTEFRIQDQLWPNAKCIGFVNSEEYIDWRKGKKTNNTYPPFVWKENTFEWNPMWYLNEGVMIFHLKRLYAFLGLNDFNEELIKEFRSKYLDTVHNLVYNVGNVNK